MLFNLSRFADSVTQIVQFSAANLTFAYNFNLVDNGRVDGESSFNAYTVGNSSDSYGLGNAAVLLRDNGAFEYLNSLSVSFFDFNVNLNGAAYFKQERLRFDPR